MKNNLSPQLEKFLETGDQASLLDVRSQLATADEAEKDEIRKMLDESESILFGSEADLEIDEPSGGRVSKKAIEAADKVKLADAQAFFAGNDKKPEATKIDIKDSGDLSEEVAADSSDAAQDDSGFTIDNPEELKKKREPFYLKPLFIDKSEVKNTPSPKEPKQEAPLSKMEELTIKAELKHAVDQYIEIMAQVVKLQNKLESEGGIGGEIPRVKIIDVLEDPRLHDPRVPSSVKSRLLEELSREVKGPDTKKETEEYESKIKEIEPAKTRVSDALDLILSKTAEIEDVERIRNSMASLVVEDDVTGVHKQEWDVACITREDEIITLRDKPVVISRPKEEVSPAIVKQIDETEAKHEADQPDAKADEIIVGSEQLAKESEEADTIEDAKQTVVNSDESTASFDVAAESTPGPTDTPAKDAEVSDLFKPKPEDDAPKKAAKNIYSEIADDSAKAESEESKVVEDETKKGNNPIAPSASTEPLAKPGVFQEFDQIDASGKVVITDSVEHKEVDLNAKEGLSAEQLADLTGKKDQEVKGVKNLTFGDLAKKVELPKHSDKKAQIQARLAELRSQPQAEIDSDIFGDDDEKIVGVDKVPLIKEHATDENPIPTAVSEEIIDEEQVGDVDDATLPEIETGLPATEVVPAEVPMPEEKETEEEKPEVEAPKADKDKEEEKGPDLVLEAPEEKKETKVAQPAPAIETPVAPKRVGLWKDFTKLIGLGKDPSFTTDKIYDTEKDIMNKRNIEVGKSAE